MSPNQFKLSLHKLNWQNFYALILRYLLNRTLLLDLRWRRCSTSEAKIRKRRKVGRPIIRAKITLQQKGVIAHNILANVVNITYLITSRKTIQKTLYTREGPTTNTKPDRSLYFSTVGLFCVEQSDPAQHTSTRPSLRNTATARAEIVLATPDASACHWLGVGSVSRLVGVVHSVNDRCRKAARNKETTERTIWAAK
jgi:hypothetical protein